MLTLILIILLFLLSAITVSINAPPPILGGNYNQNKSEMPAGQGLAFLL